MKRCPLYTVDYSILTGGRRKPWIGMMDMGLYCMYFTCLSHFSSFLTLWCQWRHRVFYGIPTLSTWGSPRASWKHAGWDQLFLSEKMFSSGSLDDEGKVLYAADSGIITNRFYFCGRNVDFLYWCFEGLEHPPSTLLSWHCTFKDYKVMVVDKSSYWAKFR